MVELQEIVGQDEAVGRLAGALTGHRRHHAFLFAGPEGVGRRTAATAFAKALLCAAAGRACGRCDDCAMFARGIHPDFHLVYKELARHHDDEAVRSRVMQDLGIPVIRQFLIGPAWRAPGRGRAKVFVVLEAELMSTEAQNSLLKTLEEPPPAVTIILVCRKPDQLLPTTRSRCTLVRFGPLPRRFVRSKLAEAGVDETQRRFWSAFTEGSAGRALRLAEEGMYAVKHDVLERLPRAGHAGDMNLGEHLSKVMDKLATAAISAAKKVGGSTMSKNLASRRAAGAMIQLIAGAYLDALAWSVGADRPAVHPDQHDVTEAVAERFSPIQLAEIIEHLSEFERLLWRNVNPRIVWDNVAVTCASAAPLRM